MEEDSTASSHTNDVLVIVIFLIALPLAFFLAVSLQRLPPTNKYAVKGERRGGRFGLGGWNATTFVIIAAQSLVIAFLLKKNYLLQVGTVPQSTDAPIISNTTSAGKRTRTLAECTIASAECGKKEFNLGPISTATECAIAVANYTRCGKTFMFSSKYPHWGCRCCVVGDAPPYPKNMNWNLHSISDQDDKFSDCCTNPTRDCLVSKMDAISTYKTASEERVSEIYGALREVVETLNKEQSKLKDPWFAFAGTLLGALRSHPPGMMRWDDDIDLAVKASSLEEVHNILKLNPRLNWKRHGQFLAYKYFLVDTSRQAAIDFFGLGKIGSDGRWHLVKPNGVDIEKNLGPTYYMEDVEIESVTPCRFWDMDLQCPSGGLAFLQRLYGEKALSRASVRNHSGGRFRPIDMVEEDLNQHAAYFPAMNRDLLNKLHFKE